MWQLKQLERLYEVEPEVVDMAIRKLFEKESLLWEKLVIGVESREDIIAEGSAARGIREGIS